MKKNLFSNPPYNLKWKHPCFAQIQKRFIEYGVPPESNANLAFILSSFEVVSDKSVFLLPCGVLTSNNNTEKEILKTIIEKNLIETIILCPNNMFESTSIPICVMVFNKNKKDTNVMFVDMRNVYTEHAREQRGQYGGLSHENRVYKKTVNVFSDDDIKKAISVIEKQEDVDGFSKKVTLQAIKENNYSLKASEYIEFKAEAEKHREYSDIVSDINRIIKERNAIKIIANETISKQLGLYEVWEMNKFEEKNTNEINKTLSALGLAIDKNNYITLSKNKFELSFLNQSKEMISSILLMVLSTWKQHVFYLNNEENRLLAELRDAILPDLMSGKLKLNLNTKEK